jgi:hypothetical protein
MDIAYNVIAQYVLIRFTVHILIIGQDYNYT